MSIVYLSLICLIPITTANKLSQASNVFGNELYPHLAQPTSNLVFSPLGVYAMLALTYQATTGQTETIMNVAIDVDSKKEVAQDYKDLITFLNEQRANVNLRIVSKIFIETGFKFMKQFKHISTDYFYTNTSKIRYSDSDDVNKEVNAWFDEESDGHIADFNEIGDVSRLTTIMMLNALYFKSRWKVPFDARPDMLEPFYTAGSSSVPMEYLRRIDTFEYYESEELDAKCLKIDFNNERFSATFILPNAREGIADLEENLRNVDIGNINNLMKAKEVEVAIPIFDFQNSIDLEEPLRAVGLGALFDMDGITDMTDGNLRMGKIMQKTLITLDNAGVSAAAGVANEDQDDIAMYTFIADHPFIFTINVNLDDDKSENEDSSDDNREVDYVVLFMGKVYNPLID